MQWTPRESAKRNSEFLRQVRGISAQRARSLLLGGLTRIAHPRPSRSLPAPLATCPEKGSLASAGQLSCVLQRLRDFPPRSVTESLPSALPRFYLPLPPR